MSKLLPAISGVACFLWVSGWTWIFSEGKQATTPSPNHTPINIFIDKAQYQVQHPFSFNFSEATPIIAEDLHPALHSIVEKLEGDPHSILKIIGVYSPFEGNKTSFQNLGLARAEAVKSLLISSGAVNMDMETAGMMAENLFEVDGKLTGVIYFDFIEQKADNQLVEKEEIKSKIRKSVSSTKSFYYKYGDYKVEKGNIAFLKSLASDLKKDGGRTVEVTGYSAPEEEAASSSIDLAEMRALAVRRYLVDHGVRREKIIVGAKPSMAKSSSEMIVSIQIRE